MKPTANFLVLTYINHFFPETSEMDLNFPDCWSVFIKYVHAHILCKWFNSVTFVTYYRATKIKQIFIKKKYLLEKQNI